MLIRRTGGKKTEKHWWILNIRLQFKLIDGTHIFAPLPPKLYKYYSNRVKEVWTQATKNTRAETKRVVTGFAQGGLQVRGWRPAAGWNFQRLPGCLRESTRPWREGAGGGLQRRGGQRCPHRGDGPRLLLHTPAPPTSNPQDWKFLFCKNSTWGGTWIWEMRYGRDLGWGERLKTGRLNSVIGLCWLRNLSLTNSQKASCLFHVTHWQDIVGSSLEKLNSHRQIPPTYSVCSTPCPPSKTSALPLDDSKRAPSPQQGLPGTPSFQWAF